MCLPKTAAVAALFSCLALAPRFTDTTQLVAQKPIVVPGGPGGYDWMKVDRQMHRLFAAHKGTGTLAVLDLEKETMLPAVQTGAAQGIAVDAADNKIFVGDETERKIVILDRKTLEKTGEIKVTGPVDAIAFDPQNGRIYADHDDGTEVWVIDGKTEKIEGTVAVAGPPEDIVYDRATARLYQNIKTTDSIQVIDPAKNTVEATWSTSPATGPHGLALDRRSQRLFSAGKNGKLAIIDIKTGKGIGAVDIGSGVDQIAFDASNKRVYCACAGVISVVQETEDGATLLGNVPAPKGAHTLAVDPGTHAVWISYADDHDSYLQKYTLP